MTSMKGGSAGLLCLNHFDGCRVKERPGGGVRAEDTLRQGHDFVYGRAGEEVFYARLRAFNKSGVQTAGGGCSNKRAGKSARPVRKCEMGADHQNVAAGLDQASRRLWTVESPVHRPHADIVGDGYSLKSKLLAEDLC